jgi:hypothetical protein
MSASDAFETDILELIFTNTNLANIGDASGLQGSTAAGNLTIALHTASPGDSGNQSTSEATYTSYARVSVARAGAQWTITGDTVDNDNAITFPTATGGSNTVTDFSIGGGFTNNMFFHGTLTASLAVSNGITPEFAAGDLDVTAA